MIEEREKHGEIKILIAEDEMIVAKDLALRLLDLGYQVTGTASTGELAVQLAQESKPALILIDMGLAGEMDGIEASEQIRARLDIPVIFLTDHDERDVPLRAKQTEPYGYLTKPLSHPILKITIETALYKHKADRSVRETEAKYRALVEKVPAITYTAGLDGASTTIYISPQIENLLGFSQEDYFADPDLWRKRLHPDDRERVMAEVAHSHDSGDPFDSEYRMIARDGTTIWFHDSAKLVCADEEGHPLCLQGVMLDISERRRSEEALRGSEQRFRAVFNNAAVGIDVLDGFGRFIEVNTALADMLGYSKEELIGISPLDLTHPEDLGKSREHLARLVEENTHAYRLEKRYVRKDGSILFAEVTVSKILDPEGNYDSTIGVISDVTDRRNAENALRVKTHDLGERVKELNCLYRISQLREHSGISLEETLQGVVDLIAPAWEYPEITCARIIWEGKEFKTQNFGDPVSKQSADILVTGEIVGSLEVVYLEERPKSDEGPFLKEERDLINAIAERLGRMLERTKAEEALQRYQAELEQLVQERTMELVKANEQLRQEITERKKAEEVLKESARALKRSNQDLEQFAYVAAHDLREPLIGVAAYLKLLERSIGKTLENESRKYLSRSLDTVIRMDFLIQSLLDYSRVTETKRKPEPTDCNTCLAQALANLRRAIKESGATISKEPLPTVMAIPVHLTQLFQNLIGNAIKFRGSSPLKIHVGVQSRNFEHEFLVRDNGIGIAPPYFDRVFQIFQRVDNSSDPGGTGIGLATCKKIVERHGGRIWVESEPGRGSIFFFTIPDRIDTTA
jgi:PAS domain S-box-containing protein